jgi:hypothetical protein
MFDAYGIDITHMVKRNNAGFFKLSDLRLLHCGKPPLLAEFMSDR